jgi:heme-degrading monooxygenase HmoA
MICVVNIYEIDTGNIAAFASAFEFDGPWPQISCRLPGYVYSNLFRQSTLPAVFLVQDYWESEDDYANAERNAEVYSFLQSLRILAVCQRSLGIFCFRDR